MSGRQVPDERLDLFVLKSPDFAAWERDHGENGSLPYRLDRLAVAGVRIGYSDATFRPPWSAKPIARAVQGMEALGAPFLQTFLAARRIGSSDATLAMFESEGNVMAWLRSKGIPPFTRPAFAIIACWLSDLLPRFGARRRALYRAAYQSVDRLFFFSSAQREIYREHLGMPDERLRFVPFGVDDEFFRPRIALEEDFVLAVGRDRGRDWPTLFRAVAGLDIKVKVLCRPKDIAGLEIPSNVEAMGYVDRFTYRDLVARSRAVLVITRVLGYPSGQSVTLESMAMGKCCVVTDTPAMRDYLEPSENAVTVPPADPEALRATIVSVASDGTLRSRIGRRAREDIESRFTAGEMWGRIADELRAAQRPTRARR